MSLTTQIAMLSATSVHTNGVTLPLYTLLFSFVQSVLPLSKSLSYTLYCASVLSMLSTCILPVYEYTLFDSNYLGTEDGIKQDRTEPVRRHFYHQFSISPYSNYPLQICRSLRNLASPVRPGQTLGYSVSLTLHHTLPVHSGKYSVLSTSGDG